MKKELTPLERLADLTRRIVAVPKYEADEREREYQKRKAKRKRLTSLATK